MKSMEEVPSSSQCNNPEISQEEALHHRPWSDLPELVLDNIAQRLTGMSSYASFASVCTTWRSASKAARDDFITSQPPSLIAYPSSILPSSNARYSILTMTDNKIHTRLIPEIPDICYYQESSPPYFESFQSSYGHFIVRRYNEYGWRPDSQSNRSASPVVVNPFTGSTILFPAAPPWFLYATLSAPPTSPDCAMLLIAYDPFSAYSYVMLCGINRTKWTVWRVPDHVEITDYCWRGAVILQDKVYVAHSSEGILEGKASSSDMRLLDIQITDNILGDKFDCHLIVVDTELLMITVKTMRAKDLSEAYRLDWMTMEWRKVMDIGYHAVFIQSGSGYPSTCEIYDTRKFQGVRRNCVYRASFKHNSFSVIPLSGGEKDPPLHISLGRAFQDDLLAEYPVWVPMTALVQGYSREE